MCTWSAVGPELATVTVEGGRGTREGGGLGGVIGGSGSGGLGGRFGDVGTDGGGSGGGGGAGGGDGLGGWEGGQREKRAPRLHAKFWSGWKTHWYKSPLKNCTVFSHLSWSPIRFQHPPQNSRGICQPHAKGGLGGSGGASGGGDPGGKGGLNGGVKGGGGVNGGLGGGHLPSIWCPKPT